MDYTKITTDELLNKFRERLGNDTLFNKIKNSAIFDKFVEILYDCWDVTNFYAQRVADEANLNTARIESNVIKHCLNLGYNPRRPIPAEAELIIKLKGPFPAELNKAGTEIFFNQSQIKLEYNGNPFILDSSYSYVLSQEDIDFCHDADWEKNLNLAVPHTNSIYMPLQGINYVNMDHTVPIKCFQGEEKIISFNGISNIDKIGKPNQEYDITDQTFSNWYGMRDPSAFKGNRNFQKANSWCKIGIGTNVEEALADNAIFDIETQAISLNSQYRELTREEKDELSNAIHDVINNSKLLDKSTYEHKINTILNNQLKICLLTSNPDKTVRLTFGNDHNVINGLMKLNENIYVKYISTKGKIANQAGVLGSTINHSNNIYASVNGNIIDITPNIEFILNSDIFCGDDFETINSMKINAPAWFRSRNKLIMPEDFQSYFSSLTSPMYVHTAYCGGQEELENSQISNNTLPFTQNYILYSLMGRPYIQNNGSDFEPRNILTSTDNISEPFSLYGKDYIAHMADYVKLLISPQGFFNQQYNDSPQEQYIKNIQSIRENCKDNLPMNSVLLSIPPFVHYFDIVGTVQVNKSVDMQEYQTRMKNKIYNYLNNLAKTTNKIYKSDIIKLYMDDKDTKYVDLNIKISNIIQSAEHKYNWNNKNNGSFAELIMDMTLDSYADAIDDLNSASTQTDNQYVLGADLEKIYANLYNSVPFNLIKVSKFDSAGKPLSSKLLENSRIEIIINDLENNENNKKSFYTICTEIGHDDKYMYLVLPMVYKHTFNGECNLTINIKTEADFATTSKFGVLSYTDYNLKNSTDIDGIITELKKWLSNCTASEYVNRAIDLPYNVFAGTNNIIRSETIKRKGNIIADDDKTLSEHAFWTWFIPKIINDYYNKNRGQSSDNADVIKITYNSSLNTDLWEGASKLIYDLYALVKPGICDSILDDDNNIVNFTLPNEMAIVFNKVNITNN